MNMSAIRIKNTREWLGERAVVKLLVFVALALALSGIFFRDFWSSLPVMLSPSWIFGQYHAAPWGVLAICLLFLWVKRKAVWERMHRRTNPVYALLGLAMLAAAIIVPFSRDYLVFQVLLGSLGLFTILFGGASRIPATYLAVYVLAVSFPLLVERFAADAYSRMAIAPLMWLLSALGYPLQNHGQLISFVTSSGEPITVAVSTACAGPWTMGVFLAFFALMMMDMPLSPKRAALTFLFGVIGTWFQNLIRLVILLLLGYYFGGNALWAAHSWTIYVLFPVWFLIFAWVYLRQVKLPRTPRGSQQLVNMSPAGE
jgi:exosortase/archaeosortase family protein